MGRSRLFWLASTFALLAPAACSKNGASPAAGGAPSGEAAAGGAASGGDAGLGGGSAKLATVRSAGCGAVAPAQGIRTVSIHGQEGEYVLSLPTGYDAEKAYPLGFAFHGYGRTHLQCQATDCAGFQSVMGQEAVLVYMKSFSDGWEQDAVRDQNADFFEAVLDSVIAETCIDEARVFAAGTSSGASFTNVLGCRYGDRLLAVAPVAGSLPESEDCVERVAAVPIHGIDDPHVTFASGEAARDFYVERNGCTATTVPELTGMHREIRASRDAMQTNHACVDYQGCDAGLPVRWCEHSQGGYDDSTHGWPSAGGQLIWDFVSQF